MKKFLPLVALAMIPGTAFAQDGGTTFAGPHATISAGWNQGNVKDVLDGARDKKHSSVAVRGAVGYDLPIGDIAIVGAEVGIATGGNDVVTRFNNNRFITNPGLTLDASARLGVKPVQNILLYGKAGWSFQRVQSKLDTPGADLSRKASEHGFLFGGGAEFALTPKLSLRAEFDRVSFNEHYKRNRALAGLSYHF